MFGLSGVCFVKENAKLRETVGIEADRKEPMLGLNFIGSNCLQASSMDSMAE